MKIYLNIIVILFATVLYAQQPPVLSTTSLANPDDDFKVGRTGNYAMDTANERDQYVGTWQYNQNGILFQVKIKNRSKLKSNFM